MIPDAATLAALFASGRIIDVILGLVALEAAALVAWRLHGGDRPLLAPLFCNLASGAALMLAIRAALIGSDWTVVALCLFASLMAHLGEVALRMFGGSRGASDPAMPDRRQPGRTVTKRA
ncbi:hypothetical protein FPV16_19570 [Methylobacterium sp. W2]|uniref:hypothetical protein n=1 Tax=Methylobacterium sp. W2 TaxID=2598107 RepID=UPI001D0CABD0|nr:hypothetical protein [Methylobacterium sp. W2]MCC0808382.1 hypothetical protein [Methylobacterium sp. W2]